MPTNRLLRGRLAWTNTLKFKIVAMAVVTGVLSAMGTTHLVLLSTQANIQNLVMRGESVEAERIAALLATKVDMLREALLATAQQAPREAWDSAEAMQRQLVANAGLNALFDSVFAARADGTMLARTAKGKVATDLTSVADRVYFQRAIATDQPVVSEPLSSKLANTPVVVIAASARRGGDVAGAFAGILALRSNNLFAEVTRAIREEGSTTLVMNRAGTVLAHSDQARLLGRAVEEPGLTEVFSRWHGVGSPIDITGTSTVSQGRLVTMAGIPYTDWTLVRLTPVSVALQPVAAAHVTAWEAAVGVGLLVAGLSGWLAWRLTRPISTLHARARKLLADGDGDARTEGWPDDGSEVGQLARAFQSVVQQRQQKQRETHALLAQLEAVLDYAQVGITFTRNGYFELVSREFCRLFDFDKRLIIGQATSLMHPSHQAYEAFSERAQPAFMEHGAFESEVQLMRPNGELFWAQMRGRAVVPGDRSQGTIWTIEDITAARAQRERLSWTSSHDSLTGLANRAAFEVLLAQATERSTAQAFCAMFIDLDHFKQVNDTGGHAAGDELLREVARALAAHVRAADTVARLGGDEFAILLEACPLARALEIGEKLRSAVTGYRLRWEGATFSVGASIGLVVVDGSYRSIADVMRAADAACYKAKQQGRNRVAVFDPAAP